MNIIPPVPDNEMDRISTLAEFDLDFSELEKRFDDLTKLAAFVAGTEISLVNFIDSYTLWTVSNYGFANAQVPREETVCQYTIASHDHFEVHDFTKDDRFKNEAWVTGEPGLRYYFGLPLQTSLGHNLGALCVIDKVTRNISPEKIEMLRIIAHEIVNRIVAIKTINNLRHKITSTNDSHQKVAQNIQGPLNGIISLAQVIADKGENNKLGDVLEFVKLLEKSGSSILNLAEEILEAEKINIADQRNQSGDNFNLEIFKTKLLKLYGTLAQSKNVRLLINTNVEHNAIPLPKQKLLQITGNLLSNAIKFTPANGEVVADINIMSDNGENTLLISVKDSGPGLTADEIAKILNTVPETADAPENGFGLILAKHLVEGLKGSFEIQTSPDEGARFIVKVPQKVN